MDLWNSFNLAVLDKYPIGKHIRLAVICCSNDILAARKLCDYILALVEYHRCYKSASSEEGQRPNFGRFEDMNEWFRMRNTLEHRHNTMIWKHQQTKEDKKNHVS